MRLWIPAWTFWLASQRHNAVYDSRTAPLLATSSEVFCGLHNWFTTDSYIIIAIEICSLLLPKRQFETVGNACRFALTVQGRIKLRLLWKEETQTFPRFINIHHMINETYARILIAYESSSLWIVSWKLNNLVGKTSRFLKVRLVLCPLSAFWWSRVISDAVQRAKCPSDRRQK